MYYPRLQMLGKRIVTQSVTVAYAALIQVDTTLNPKTDDYDHPTPSSSWLDWMLQGGWMNWVKIFSLTIAAFLIILCTLSVCIIPGCKCLVKRIVTQSVTVAYAALIQVDTTLNPKTDDYDDTEKVYFTELQNEDHYSYDDML
ncbi:hypothetical protein AMECASPLE_029730 [Ameca splendens]|uniref:Uncharacterized protein n=1 Tax=Ameca splendens TaxID=208324 RepID=A0ABV0Z4W4_9TELE